MELESTMKTIIWYHSWIKILQENSLSLIICVFKKGTKSKSIQRLIMEIKKFVFVINFNFKTLNFKSINQDKTRKNKRKFKQSKDLYTFQLKDAIKKEIPKILLRILLSCLSTGSLQKIQSLCTWKLRKELLISFIK